MKKFTDYLRGCGRTPEKGPGIRGVWVCERGPARVLLPGRGLFRECVSGCVLLSHTVTSAVPSALKGLASGFGMEPGVSPSL